MRRAWVVVGLALCLGGCASPQQERVRDYNEVGVTLYRQGNYAAAADSFQAALALTPADAALMYDAGQCYDRLGDAARAEQLYNKCLAQDAGHAGCRTALCQLLVRQGRTDEAVKMVEAWMAREPRRAAAYAADGWLWHHERNLPKAQARLQRALELDAHDHVALAELALVYEETHRPDRAVVLYERMLQEDPHQPDVVDRLNRLQGQKVGRPKFDE
jgi:tetratricopeptide (TPR) repeat protein